MRQSARNQRSPEKRTGAGQADALGSDSFEILFNSAPYAVAISGLADGRFVKVNDKLCELTGYSRDDLVGKTTLEMGFYEDPSIRDRLVSDLKTTGTCEELENRIRTRDGRILTGILYVRLLPLLGESYIFTTIIDITARRQAEEAQKQALSLLQATLESTADGILVIDRAGKVTSFNAKFKSLWKLPENVIRIGDDQRLLTFVESQLKDPEGFFERIKELYASPESESLDILEFKDGRVFERYSQPQRIDGTVAGRVWSFRDITERTASERKLLASEAKYRELANSVPVGIYESDLSGRVTFVNDFGRSWSGYTEEDFVAGFNFLDVLSEEDRKRARENMAKAASSPGFPTPNEYTVRLKDGSTSQALIMTGPQFREDSLVGFRGIMIDLTEKKKMEAVIQNAARLESLGMLAGGVAHDFNNLMGGLFGCINMAIESSADPEVSNYLSKAMDTIRRARSLTDQLLTFADGGAPIRKPCRLFPLVRETAEFALSGSPIACRFDVEPDLPACVFDPNQISQVIENLVINAKQAMPGGGTIDISSRTTSVGEGENPGLKPGTYVRISVSDSGVGISPDIRERIFDPFFTTRQMGHGLGLATSYSIAIRHEGIIEVTSEPGKGSTFSLYLPASDLPPPDETDRPRPSSRTGRGRILFMDDQKVLRDVISAMLKMLGFSVVCTADGKETVRLIEEETRAGRGFDALILDLTIPGGTGGKETLAEIREINPAIPAFVASGYAEDPIMANPHDYGFTGSIRKPFTVNELSAMLENNLKRNETP